MSYRLRQEIEEAWLRQGPEGETELPSKLLVALTPTAEEASKAVARMKTEMQTTNWMQAWSEVAPIYLRRPPESDLE